MRRLKCLRRLIRDEHGQTSVVTALLMVALLGMAALVIDVGLLYYERAQLKNGADAAALAVAQECAAGQCPTDPQLLATTMASLNAADDTAGVDHDGIQVDTDAARVTVETTTRTDEGEHALAFFFAPILGIDSSTVRTSSTAAWFSPIAGDDVFPLAISWCQFEGKLDQGVQRIDVNPNLESNNCSGSTIPRHTGNSSLPGGFGWLDPTQQGVCATQIDLTSPDGTIGSDWVGSDPGANVPQGCKPLLESWEVRTPVRVMLPIYGGYRAQGNKGEYEIVGFAAFDLYGWDFGGVVTHNGSDDVAFGRERAIIGEFVTFVTLDVGEQGYVFGEGGRDLGTSLVTLTE